MPRKDELSPSVAPCGEPEPFPGKFDNPLSQFTSGSDPVSRGLGSILTYKGEPNCYQNPREGLLGRAGQFAGVCAANSADLLH